MATVKPLHKVRFPDAWPMWYMFDRTPEGRGTTWSPA
jgi:hypothetical protein